MIADSQIGVDPTVSVHFLRSTLTDERGGDEIDRDLDEMIQVDPYNGDSPSKRKDSELTRVLAILDSLEEERRSV